ncbi:hypothetical protein LO80_01665 [Candidatus Francisella endociliophora]|uniref:Uncharacterized protein n=2 Tax=Candidatus Francisella endociliophora TaxID=653937 RepID=A0A097EMK9_9GAMM|nr:hypothetical protein LO80_01665 [Francisella sp. FSC1006]
MLILPILGTSQSIANSTTFFPKTKAEKVYDSTTLITSLFLNKYISPSEEIIHKYFRISIDKYRLFNIAPYLTNNYGDKTMIDITGESRFFDLNKDSCYYYHDNSQSVIIETRPIMKTTRSWCRVVTKE